VDGITRVAERVERVRQRVTAGGEEPVRSAVLEILTELQSALEALPSLQREPATEHLKRAEKLTGVQIARLRRDVLPPRPARTSEAAFLDRKADLIRLLDLRASDETLVEYVAELAHDAGLQGDALTLYALASGPLDLYYKARGVDDLRIRERIVGQGTGGAAAQRLELLLGPDGIAALVRDLRGALADPDVARAGQGGRVSVASDLPDHADLLPNPDEGAISEDLTPEEQRDNAATEHQLRQIALLAGELGALEGKSDSATAMPPSPPPGPDPPMVPEPASRTTEPHSLPAGLPVAVPSPVDREERDGRGRSSGWIGWKAALLFLAATILLLLDVYFAFFQPPRDTTDAPTATVVLGLSPATPAPPPPPEPSPVPTVVLATAVGAPSPTSVPSPVPQAPSPTPIPSLIPSPASVTPSAPSPTSVPPTETEVVAPPRVASSGFAQRNQDASCAFVVQSGGAGSVAESLRYQVIATDGAGATLRTDSGSIASIRPGDHVGIASRFSLSPGQTIAHCALQLTPVANPSASPPPLVTSDVVVADAAPLRVAGVIRNPSPSVASGVEVHAIAYDASGGAIIGGGTERVGDLTPNSRTRVTVPLITSAPPAEVELYAIPSLPP
jgi:hypothetical protein